jgi:hypothetical protein
VRTDRHGAQPVAEALGGDQRRAVGRDRQAVRERQRLADELGRAVRVDQCQLREGHVGATVEIEPEAADVGPAVGIDHHVVEQTDAEARQVGVQGQLAVGFLAQHAPIAHRHDQQPAVGQPAEPRGLMQHLGHLGDRAVKAHRDDPVGVEVRQPQTTVAPARRLQEAEALNERVDGPFRHGASARRLVAAVGSGPTAVDEQHRAGDVRGRV